MIKSTKVTTKFANSGKRELINLFIAEYRAVVATVVDYLWDADSIPKLVPTDITSKINSPLSARAIQCAAKQASGIVRGTKSKQKKRLFMINKLHKDGKHKQARRLQAIYDKQSISKPNILVVNPELDSRFVTIDIKNDTTFDGWIKLSSIGNKLSIKIPFKKTKHFNKLATTEAINNGIRISNKDITFCFNLQDPEPILIGDTIGIDVGQTTILSVSNGQVVDIDNHGHSYQSICSKLSKKKRGSKGFKKVVNHRSNFIHWAINQLCFSGIKQVNIENIKYLRRGKRTRRSLTHWNYGELFDVLESYLIDAGVQINKISPTYTSQRCSNCDWTRKGNRKKKQFRCDKCGFTCDSDLNASFNIALPLLPISSKQRLRHDNRKGFYWKVKGQESIVPVVHQTNYVTDFTT